MRGKQESCEIRGNRGGVIEEKRETLIGAKR